MVQNIVSLRKITVDVVAMFLLVCAGSVVAGAGDGKCQAEDRSCSSEECNGSGGKWGPRTSK
jgi:hypothetical protein